MTLKEFPVLSRPRSGRVEGRTALIQLGYSLLRRGDEFMGGGGINSQTLEARHSPPIAMLLRFADPGL
jgi:hypothetical protein